MLKPPPMAANHDQDEPTPKDIADIHFIGAESLLGRPPQVPPAEGIAIMRRRLDQLDTLILDASDEDRRLLLREIRDTQQRLTEYETQLRSHN